MAAYKRSTGSPNSKVVIDKKTGVIKVYSYLTVLLSKTIVRVFSPSTFPYVTSSIKTLISLTEARKRDKTLNVGDTIDTEVTPKEEFGRVATSTAKQVLIQKIRENF